MNLFKKISVVNEHFYSVQILTRKWFPLQGERAHSLKLFGMYDKRFEIKKNKIE